MSSHDSAQSFRRKYPRRAFQRVVGILHHGQYYLAQATEVGEGGMAIELDAPLEHGEMVVVSFQIPEGSFVSLRAEVRQGTGSTGVLGLEFKNIRFGHKRQIRTYVSARSDSNSFSL